MADIDVNLQEEENNVDIDAGSETYGLEMGLRSGSGDVDVGVNDQEQELRMGIEPQEQSIEEKILSAESAAEEAIAAKLAAQQAAQDAEDYALQTRSAVNNINNNLGEMETNVAKLRNRVNALEASSSLHVTNGEVEDGVAYFYNEEGDTLFSITGIGGGGGGSGGGDTAGSVVTLTNNTGWASTTVAENVDVILSFTWSSLEDGNPTGQGVMTVEVGGAVRESLNIAQGNFTVNVKNYLNRGDNRVVVRVTDGYGKSKWKQFNVTVEQLKLESTFDDSEIQTGALTYTYTPYGAFTKTIHFELDGTEMEPTVTSATGRQMSQIIRQQSHAAHRFRVWFTATINGQTVTSNVLSYDIIWAINGNNSPIIASSFDQNIVDQYSTLTIPFMVYNPTSMVSDVTIKLDGMTIQTLPDVGREMQSFQIRMDDEGNHAITIHSGAATKVIGVQVNEAEMTIAAETENLLLYLTSSGRTNLEAHPETWQSTINGTTLSSTLTGFNFISNGWIRDTDNVTALRVNAGASVTIPFQPFATDFRSTGYTIEIEFAVRDVQDYAQTVISCMNGNRGFMITSQNAEIKSEQSSLGVQFKDEDHIRIAFQVGKRSTNRLLMCYINGIPSRVVQYPDSDDFTQTTPVNITISGTYCTCDIYNIRMYNNDLTGEQLLNNWIADTQDGELMLQRYSRNNVYNAYGEIAINKLPGDLPYMIIECPELPQYKGDKKTCVGSFVNPMDPTKSFTFTGCQINVQGTSSAVYARKNYDMQFKNGFEMSNGSHADNFQMVSTVKPFNRFVMKADVASSEGANNVELVKAYCDMTPYKTREMLEDPQVRQGIYGFPIVIFWTNTDSGETTFLGKYNFNFPKRAPAPYGYHDDMESWEFQNNTSNLMLFKSDYFDETLMEDPTTGDIKETWRYDYEARFPDDTWTDYSKLQELQSFVYSTYRAEATGDALAQSVTYDGVTYTTDSSEYRLAKFKAEIGNYAEINSLIFYYVFTLFFLLADSRAKNLFIGFSGSDTDPNKVTAIDRKAVAEPYDMDTALGINNEGSLTFTYSLEDTDILSNGREVYTGQQSVLWNNIRDAFPTEIRQMYQTLRSGTIFNYNTIEKRFEDHQAYWPEAIWIEDSRFKYIYPLINPDPGKEPTGAYLEMMLGSKHEQRRWWLSNRFKYMDSKFSAGDALSEVIQFRAYARSSLTITPYSDLYVTVKYGSYVGQEKTTQGTPVTITVPIDNLSDTETYIYSASQIADVGDMSEFKLGWADFSHATRIQQIKIGDSDSNYENLPFERLTLGNNRLLTKIDCRNCPNLGSGEQKTVDMSGCTSIREAYFDGTSITGVELANGSPLTKLHLPGTVTNLSLRNQTSLTEFVLPDYSHITTLWLENPASCIDTAAIVDDLPSGCRVRLYNFYWNLNDLEDVSNLFDKLDLMRGLDQNGNNTERAQVFGTIHVDEAVGSQIVSIQSRYPDVRITYSHVTSNVYYYSWDGETLIATKQYRDGVGELYSGQPSRTSTEQYSFTFAGWALSSDAQEADENAFVNVSADRMVYAAYSRTVRTYTVTFKLAAIDGGSTLQTIQNVPYGTTPSYTGSTPVSTNLDGGIYTFAGWSPELGPITGDTTYTATFFDSSVTVTFMNGETVLKSDKIPNGGNATAPATDPTKEQTVSTVYTFAGWSINPNATEADPNALTNITSSRVLYAVFTESARLYTITFVRGQEDGGGTLQTVDTGYGSVPSYTGATPTTTKTDSVYTFSGWSPALTAVTGPATYTAVFTDVGVSVTFKNGNTTLTTVKVASGSNATYTGATPTKASTAQYTYTFAGWHENPNAITPDPNALNNITYAKTLYAIFTETARTYTITFKKASEDGGQTLQTSQFAYGTMPSYNGETPTTTRTGFVFTGWTPALSAVTGDQIYVASFVSDESATRQLIKRTIEYAEHSEATIIGNVAFRNCFALTTASFPAAMSIESEAFYGCSSLTTALFPSATYIGNSAFNNCSALTTVSFPAATSIGQNAFQSCRALTTALFPVATSIGDYAFQKCFALTTAVFGNSSVCSGGATMFYGVSNLTIYVPDNLVNDYKIATNWSEYASRIKGISELPN